LSIPTDYFRTAISIVLIPLGTEHAGVVLVVKDAELISYRANSIDWTLTQRAAGGIALLDDAGVVLEGETSLAVVAGGTTTLKISAISHKIVTRLAHQILVNVTGLLLDLLTDLISRSGIVDEIVSGSTAMAKSSKKLKISTISNNIEALAILVVLILGAVGVLNADAKTIGHIGLIAVDTLLNA
jgi:hypothetical protein